MDNNTDHEIEIVHGRAVDPVSGTTIQNHAWIECELPHPKGWGFLLHSFSIETSPQALRRVPRLIPKQDFDLARQTS